MKIQWCRISVAFVVVLLAVSGCGKRDNGTEQTSGPAPVSAEELAAVKKAMTRGMQAIGFANLKPVHVGKGCVVETRTPDGGLQIKPPPPPPGMVHAAGQVTFYRGELDSITSESLTIRKGYPTPGNFKEIEIPKGDIRSIYLVP